MMQIVPNNLNFDFIGKWKIAFTISLLLTVWSIYVWTSLGEKKFGTDFTGGYSFVVKVASDVNSELIRSAVDAAGFPDSVVQSFEAGTNQYSIRMGGGEGPEAQIKETKQKVEEILKKVSPKESEILSTDFVGPTIGKELRTKALLAIIIGCIGLLVYITLRFEFGFALGAVVAVFHDVNLSIGIFLAAGHTINMGGVAAALTILGYSVNDTIVIFDRVREELRNPRYKDMDLASLINMCINLTLSRTIITVGLTLFSVAALLLFGGGAIADLSFFLFVGMICGTYSTIYIASPVVLAWEWWRRRKEVLQPA